MTAPPQSWHYHKGRLQKTAAMLFAMAIVFGLFAFAHWFGALMAIATATLGIVTLIQAAGTKPVLTVGPEGLHFARFSKRTIPWSNIDEVAVVRGMQRGVAWGRVHQQSNPMMDEIAFSLKEYEGYSGVLASLLRSFRTAYGAPGVPCNVWQLDGAPVDDVARAIHAQWNGKIQDMIPVDGKFEKRPWTGSPPV